MLTILGKQNWKTDRSVNSTLQPNNQYKNYIRFSSQVVWVQNEIAETFQQKPVEELLLSIKLDDCNARNGKDNLVLLHKSHTAKYVSLTSIMKSP